MKPLNSILGGVRQGDVCGSIFVTADELSVGITDDEYGALLDRQYRKSYFNDANKDSGGTTVDVNAYILKGAKILIDATQGA